ncbi:glutathione S-transferase family protein [Govanella unica]|uniref:Glutathione S-transferase family protein n=1 Tax=Govanella unica TaxID=2975056 RepID=A0A9X3Z6I6_9PROT|nr:glutathione S-transferase family protein [Govania unica]MDA5192964.1 glutathione S-transferase family protein [Govania unica]
MSAYELVIGDKSFSSWSLRPWLLLKVAGVPFIERNVRLRQPDSREQILTYSPSGKVPLLLTEGFEVWDSLAIAEYIAECLPEKALWPRDQMARARARAISAEMHAGFPDLRNELSMDILNRHPTPELSAGAARDVARVQEIWRSARAEARGGPFLFGHFTVADAMYAPVVTRFISYNIPLDPVCRAYADVILDLPAMIEWTVGAKAETA